MPVFIEWIENDTLQRGTLKKEDKGKIQAVSLTGRSLSLRSKRFHLRHQGAGEAEAFFAAVDREAAEIDMELLHEAVEAGGTFNCQELAVSWFSQEPPASSQISAMLGACLGGAPFFKVDSSSGRVMAATEDAIGSWRRKQEARRREDEERRMLAAELRACVAGGDAGVESAPGEGPRLGDEKLWKRIEEHLLAQLLAGEAKERAGRWPALTAALREQAAEAESFRDAFARKVLARRGRLPSAYTIQMKRFHRSFYRQKPQPELDFTPGHDLCPTVPEEELARIAAHLEQALPGLPGSLHNTIFSVDDETTQEIDDALSVEDLDAERFRVGVHIAAPGIFIPEESRTHELACARATTVYQPDLKWPMLPKALIELFTLAEGREVPAVSAYYTISKTGFEVLDVDLRLERIVPTRNLSYQKIDDALEGGFFPDLELIRRDPGKVMAWLDRDVRDFPWERRNDLPPAVEGAIDLLVPLARYLFVGRQKAGTRLFYRREHKIHVFADGRVSVTERRRNSLIEGIVTELMILNNHRMASLLAESEIPAIYRTQRLLGSAGRGQAARTKADLTVNPREHVGLGASFYCWTTSPLRRYSDLINQRQLGSVIGGALPLFDNPSELLVRAKKMEFQNDIAYRHQNHMERYWVLKYLEQESGLGGFPVTIHRRDEEVKIAFEKLPLRLTRHVSEVRKTGGLALFHPQSFDFYELQVSGTLSDREAAEGNGSGTDDVGADDANDAGDQPAPAG